MPSNTATATAHPLPRTFSHAGVFYTFSASQSWVDDPHTSQALAEVDEALREAGPPTSATTSY